MDGWIGGRNKCATINFVSYKCIMKAKRRHGFPEAHICKTLKKLHKFIEQLLFRLCEVR